MTTTVVYKIEWWESERGWGRKPLDKITYHETREDAEETIREHWKEYPDDHVPDYYIAPGEIEEIAITDEIKAILAKKL